METAAKTAGVHLYPMLSQMIGCLRSISSRDGFQIELIAVTLLPPHIHHDWKKKCFSCVGHSCSRLHILWDVREGCQGFSCQRIWCVARPFAPKRTLWTISLSQYFYSHTQSGDFKVIGLILKQTFPNVLVQNLEYFIWLKMVQCQYFM